MTKPRVFIASSVEGLNIAFAIQENLEHFAEPTVWPQGVFNLSEYTMDDLIQSLETFDFGIFVFSYEDITTMRGDDVKTARDNVLFELGLFMGGLGRQRCFIVMPRSNEKLHLPTDLLGIKPATFDPDRSDENLSAALGPPCYQISQVIGQLGRLIDKSAGSGKVKPSPHTPDSVLLNNLVNGALETVCRAVSVPITPESSHLRVFIFKKIEDELVCSHFWSPNPVKEMVGKLRFSINVQTAGNLAVVKAFATEQIMREDINAQEQRELAASAPVSDALHFILAAPIFSQDGSVWGVVDFDASNEQGKQLLNTEVADAAMFRLAQHLKLIFSLQN
jgi:predicted nucleotide-binding protein with TIR-like domain